MGHILFTPHRPIVPPVYPVKYGLLYNRFIVDDARKLSSSDTWVIPLAGADWTTLRDYLGGATVAGGKLKEQGLVYWLTPNTGATNEVNFYARGSGIRYTGLFQNLQQYCWFMDRSSGNATSGTIVYLLNNASTITITAGNGGRTTSGMAVRLVRPAIAAEQLLADGTACDPYVGNDGKIYRTVKIGTQVWLADNLAETKFRNGDYIHGYEGGVYTPISNADWAALTTAGVCCYLDNLDNI